MFSQQYELLRHKKDNKQHPLKSHWVSYSDKVRALVSGEGYEKLLRQFAPREDEAAFEQRVRLTKEITKGISNRILASPKRALRNDEIERVIEPTTLEEELTKDYYKGKTVEEYSNEYIYPVSVYDPNAWLILDVIPFDNTTQKAPTYPFIAHSKDVVNFELSKQGFVNWLIIENKDRFIMYNQQREERMYSGEVVEYSGKTYVLHLVGELKDHAYSFDFDKFCEKLDKGNETLVREEIESSERIKIGNYVYVIEGIDPQIEKIQCFQLGYLLDMQTRQQSYISLIDPCLPRLESIANTGSEMFLTKALHAFPQKIIRSIPCPGHRDEHDVVHSCVKGSYSFRDEDGNFKDKTCPSCNGKGKLPIHTSAQDVIEVPIGEDKDATLDLDEVMKYVQTDVEIMKFQDTYIQEQTEECLKDMYARSSYSVNTAQKTATEANLNEESVDDVLFPFTQFMSEVYEWQITTRAMLRDETLEKVSFRYPSSLLVRTRMEAIQEYQNTEGAPLAVRMQTAKEIVRKQFRDDKEEANKHIVQMSFEPFQGLSEVEKQIWAANAGIYNEDVYFYFNQQKVWNYIDNTFPEFYQSNYTVQVVQLREALKTLMPERPTLIVPDGE